MATLTLMDPDTSTSTAKAVRWEELHSTFILPSSPLTFITVSTPSVDHELQQWNHTSHSFFMSVSVSLTHCPKTHMCSYWCSQSIDNVIRESNLSSGDQWWHGDVINVYHVKFKGQVDSVVSSELVSGWLTLYHHLTRPHQRTWSSWCVPANTRYTNML